MRSYLAPSRLNFTWPLVFWIAALATLIAVVILLRGVLLPFVAGAALAYLLNPIANRIEQLGINRLVATLVIIGIVALGIAVLMVLTIPTIVHKVSYFIESLPLYLKRLQTLGTDATRPWLAPARFDAWAIGPRTPVLVLARGLALSSTDFSPSPFAA
jgi:predicted PurR-regulated permease PerM